MADTRTAHVGMPHPQWQGVFIDATRSEAMTDERKVLERVLEEATDFLDGLKDRRVAARTDVEGVANALRRPLPRRAPIRWR